MSTLEPGTTPERESHDVASHLDGAELEVRFPARSGFLRICRINAAAYGADAGFDVDDLDDLRLAVNESVTWLLGDDQAGGVVTLRLRAVDDGLAFEAERTGSSLPDRDVDDIVHAILGATTDDYVTEADAERRLVRLTKTRADH
ncbi:MAG: hypothetical protein ACRBI6_00880 [Acidimicrobiales bacterium]